MVPAEPAVRRRRGLVALAVLAAAGAAGVLLVWGGLRSLTALLLGAAGLALICAAAWWYLTRRGAARWLAAAVLVAVPAGLITAYVLAGLLADVLVSGGLATVSAGAWRAARAGGRPPLLTHRPRGRAARPPRHPFLIMNPRSGGGKVARFGLADRARALGAQVALLHGPGMTDVAALAATAVDDGADLLGVAGGDGTQALVAGVAAGRDVPMLVISAGTRNHFALDLGLDRDDPAQGLDALTDGVELRIDLGQLGERTFVNNASFGAYAQVVQSPEYRNEKTATALALLPDLLGEKRAGLRVTVDGALLVDRPQAVLVSNNPYQVGDTAFLAGAGRRARLDTGVLGVVAIKVESGAQAAALLSRRSRGLTIATGRDVVIESDEPLIPVGVDGEALTVPTPVRCTIRPRALRVLVPRTDKVRVTGETGHDGKIGHDGQRAAKGEGRDRGDTAARGGGGRVLN
jgi:diacylglycerol kinase family enzyme